MCESEGRTEILEYNQHKDVLPQLEIILLQTTGEEQDVVKDTRWE